MSKFDNLMEKEVTRKEFLAAILAGIIAIFGFSSIVGMFSKNDESDNSNLPEYGMGNYGP